MAVLAAQVKLVWRPYGGQGAVNGYVAKFDPLIPHVRVRSTHGIKEALQGFRLHFCTAARGRGNGLQGSAWCKGSLYHAAIALAHAVKQQPNGLFHGLFFAVLQWSCILGGCACQADNKNE
jgi:hypothetical protein